MELKYEIITEKELDCAGRLILAGSMRDFSFLFYGGRLKINADLPNVETLEELVKRLWMVDCVETAEDERLTENVYNEVEKLSGGAAADTLWRAWHDAVTAYRKNENNAKARAWYTEYYDLDAFDAIPGYDSGFIDALTRVAYEHKDEHRPDPYAAVFLWAYNLGREAATK